MSHYQDTFLNVSRKKIKKDGATFFLCSKKEIKNMKFFLCSDHGMIKDVTDKEIIGTLGKKVKDLSCLNDTEKDYFVCYKAKETIAFNIKKKQPLFIKGYIYVDNNKFIAVKQNIFLFILFLFLLIALIIGLIYLPTTDLFHQNNITINGINDVSYAGFDTLSVDSNNRYITLQNVSDNSKEAKVAYNESLNTEDLSYLKTEENIYLKYKIIEQSTSNVLYESDYIAPGNVKYWNAYNDLSTGTHVVNIEVYAYNKNSLFYSECSNVVFSDVIIYVY
jgi:hypothetical protein